jgi:hypothetical protein
MLLRSTARWLASRFDALDRDASQRAAFFDAACAGDESLRQEVESGSCRSRAPRAFWQHPPDKQGRRR